MRRQLDEQALSLLCGYAEQCDQGIVVIDPEGCVVYANKSRQPILCTIDGVWRLELSCVLRDQDGRTTSLGTALDLVRSGEGKQELEFECNCGKETEVMGVRLLPLGGYSGFVLLETRIIPITSRLRQALLAERTTRRRIEHLSRRGRALFYQVIENLPLFVYMQRPDYSVAYANKKTRIFYGETTGRLCYEVFAGRSSPCLQCPTFRVFETGKPEEWEFKDRLGRTFRIYDYPFEDENGQPLVMELGVDLTELKRVERELYQAQKMRAVGVLAGGIAHDLNNNLVPIIFNVDYALGKSVDPMINEPLSEALRAAYRAADLVEQVLDYSRQQNLRRFPLRLVTLVQESLDLLQASLPASVHLYADFQTERDWISANPSQIQQLLLNLCRNAVQAMPGGGELSVRVSGVHTDGFVERIQERLPQGEYVVLEVVDTGVGIDLENVDRVFEPFYTTKRDRGGTGMGLAVVHAIVASNGGDIRVHSSPGEGARFVVRLPFVDPSTMQPQDMGQERKHGRYEGSAEHRSMRLLLVDDDMGALNAMQRVLREAGLDVVTAENGEHGLKQFIMADEPFDLILADHSMPGMSGMEMAENILEQEPKATIVICTGHVEAQLEKQARTVGIAGFLMKPMTPGMLLESVRRYRRRDG
ncbi:MAG: response regulator [Desulfovibrionales bacterium]|nr:MAG: response regulator [Desulfovibrionales bacterium]